MPVIHIETFINADIEIVFDLARSVDLHQLSTAKTNEEVVGGRKTGLMELGEEVTWRARHFGIYQKLTSKITAFERPLHFTDEMTKGIFKRFVHKHSFQKSEKGTIMIDDFNYTSPLGPLGIAADRLFLKRYMTKFLIERNRVIKSYAEKTD